ncbi:MAG TPA: hypothetical protein VH969_16445 [Actinophytocola sp.]|jgi:uncharacterized protein YukE|uniref:hypothetical protein n=1 Tax=Actinophytocola sp. TaxID=1872138 RepID=UPI002F94D151
MDFRHQALRGAALSDEMLRLSEAASRLGTGPDPIERLYLLDCVPSEMHHLADSVLGPAKTVHEVGDDFENTRARLLRRWHGEAADAFASSSLDLLTSYITRSKNSRETGQAGKDIADGLDDVAASGADFASRTAGAADDASVLVITMQDDAPEDAKAIVRQAVAEIDAMVDAKQDEIASIGSRLDKISAV